MQLGNSSGFRFSPTFSLEEKLAVLAAVLLVILDANGAESLADGASRLVSSENAFARSGDEAGVLDELSSVGTEGHFCRVYKR
jgi:hypothetical protein